VDFCLDPNESIKLRAFYLNIEVKTKSDHQKFEKLLYKRKNLCYVYYNLSSLYLGRISGED